MIVTDISILSRHPFDPIIKHFRGHNTVDRILFIVMPSFNHSTKARSSSNNRLAHLLDLMDRIQSAPTISIMEQSMHSFTKELLQIENKGDNAFSSSEEVTLFTKGDETILTDLECRGAISILLRAMINCLHYEEICRKDASGSQRYLYDVYNDFNSATQILCQYKQPYCRISPQFFNSACIAIVHFAFQSRRRSKEIVDHGGFDVVVRMMTMYRSVDYVQIIGMAALMILGQVYSFPYCGRSHGSSINGSSSSIVVAEAILEQIVLAMESHVLSSRKLFDVACSALSTLWGCSDKNRPDKPADHQKESLGRNTNHNGTYHNNSQLKENLKNMSNVVDDNESRHGSPSHMPPHRNPYYERALTAIGIGSCVHISEDPMAWSTGETLLFRLMGRSSAERMITCLERNSASSNGFFGYAAASA